MQVLVSLGEHNHVALAANGQYRLNESARATVREAIEANPTITTRALTSKVLIGTGQIKLILHAYVMPG